MRAALTVAAAGVLVAGLTALAAEPPDAASPVTARVTDPEPIVPLPPAPSLDPRVVALGRALFADARLSADGARSCQSCHDLSSNGATGRPFDLATGADRQARNTPTIFNAALNFRFDWSGDALSLEQQADRSLRVAMGQDAADAAVRLSSDSATVARFRAAYGRGPDQKAILDALASFERTLLTPDSPFDRWLEGDRGALSAQAREGYERFKAIGCISCHQGVNIGGNLYEQSGIYRVLTDSSRPMLRVPSLRNVAATAPYFHDGSVSALPDAVRLMARAQLGRAMPDDTVALIVAFLDSLTGQYDGHAVRPPRPR